MATTGMRIPDPPTLRDAVKEVIRQNQEVGYNPGRFIQATQNGEAEDLVGLCQYLVNDHSNFDILVDGVTKYPTFLSLEDLITHSCHGGEWGLDDPTVIAAEERAETLDRLRQSLGKPRFG